MLPPRLQLMKYMCYVLQFWVYIFQQIDLGRYVRYVDISKRKLDFQYEWRVTNRRPLPSIQPRKPNLLAGSFTLHNNEKIENVDILCILYIKHNWIVYKNVVQHKPGFHSTMLNPPSSLGCYFCEAQEGKGSGKDMQGYRSPFSFLSLSKHKANTTELHSKVRPTYILGKVRLGWDDQGLGSSLDLKTCCIFMQITMQGTLICSLWPHYDPIYAGYSIGKSLHFIRS